MHSIKDLWYSDDVNKRKQEVVMKEKLKSKVVLQTVAQLPNHPLVRKAGLFFCQGFKDIRMARSEIFMTSYFSKLLPVSKDFMGSLPKDPGPGKKLCGVQKFSVVKGIKKKSTVRTSTLWLSQQAGVLTDRGRAIKPPAVIPLQRSHRQSGTVIVPRPQGE